MRARFYKALLSLVVFLLTIRCLKIPIAKVFGSMNSNTTVWEQDVFSLLCSYRFDQPYFIWPYNQQIRIQQNHPTSSISWANYGIPSIKYYSPFNTDNTTSSKLYSRKKRALSQRLESSEITNRNFGLFLHNFVSQQIDTLISISDPQPSTWTHSRNANVEFIEPSCFAHFVEEMWWMVPYVWLYNISSQFNCHLRVNP